MLEKPKAITTIGIVQILLAATFVVWLVFFPSTGWNFAWPVTPAFSAMFIGAGFIARTYIGYYLWREKHWAMLRWQVNANYAFLFVIFLATYWHVDEMNWKSNIIVAHIWVLAYTIEPIMLYLLEPRGEASKTPLPAEFQEGPVLPGLKRVAVLGLVVAATLAGLFFINPRFMNTRWPWPLDPFNARIMAAFLILAGGLVPGGVFRRTMGRDQAGCLWTIHLFHQQFRVVVSDVPTVRSDPKKRAHIRDRFWCVYDLAGVLLLPAGARS